MATPAQSGDAMQFINEQDTATLERFIERWSSGRGLVQHPASLPRVRSGTYVPWGLLAALDLHGCERGPLADPDTIRRCVPILIDAIGMRAHGPLRIERFGDGELEGWSAMQFIETSSITLHADEVGGRCFVDVFSCRPFDPAIAARIAVAHFGGTASVTVLRR